MEAGHTQRAPNGRADEASIAELVSALSEQTSRLAREEVELAKAELTEKGKRIGIGAGAFGAAGLIGLFALGAFTAFAILGLAELMDAWLAALAVTALYAVVAGVLALTGKSQVEKGTPPVPEQAIDSTKTDVDQAKAKFREGRS